MQNLASRAPWDFSVRTGTPTFTTLGNNARTAEAWSSPLTPGPTGFRPVSASPRVRLSVDERLERSKCFTPFVPGESHDIAAAIDEPVRDAQPDARLDVPPRLHRAALERAGVELRHRRHRRERPGDRQLAGRRASGGFPSYLGRDNANMVALPDGVPPITNMYLWQPIAGTFYAPCVDGDYDMAVIGHEYGHLVENRMIGKGGTRGGHHAGAMGESSGDLMGMEYLNEYGFVPGLRREPVRRRRVRDRQQAARDPQLLSARHSRTASPLNFSDMGYDLTGPQVHADGEIWRATNYDIRQALVAKYGAGDAQSQLDCAEGTACRPAQLPGQPALGAAHVRRLPADADGTVDARRPRRVSRRRPDALRRREPDRALARVRRCAASARRRRARTRRADSDVDPTPDFASPSALRTRR